MKRHIKRMMQDLRHRERDQQLKQLRKRIGSKSGTSMEKPPIEGDDDWDFDDEQWDEFVEMEQQHHPRLKHELKKRRKRRAGGDAPADPAPASPLARGVVFTVRKRRVRASVGGELVTCWLSANMASQQKTAIAVGDEVLIETKGEDHVVTEVVPRRTALVRPDPHDFRAERVIAANVDVVIQVSAAKNPPLRLGLIDRYLVAVERGGAEPAVCVNKVDLLDDDEKEEIERSLADYRTLGIPIVWCSTKTGEGIETLRNLVAGRAVVLVGHSGVGKSSLLNALDESLDIATNVLHKAGRAGRHTTTSSTLHEFPDGTRLIDTPGIREFGLGQMSVDELRFYFSELMDLGAGCRFRDCSHLHEPDCAVKAAAESGELPTGRYQRYVRLSRELSS